MSSSKRFTLSMESENNIMCRAFTRSPNVLAVLAPADNAKSSALTIFRDLDLRDHPIRSPISMIHVSSFSASRSLPTQIRMGRKSMRDTLTKPVL
ncbi:hypothetical protein DERF_007657 [Dermatophagoides farinae]|uniref:Uncharacterized protein n=1 Tax=Dermatophagoides farinae TaxID=6954 RepID=A0A922I0T8_DERFA|nr:hypothetical protein DERF_007657 [Dermatophagoides farinae]